MNHDTEPQSEEASVSSLTLERAQDVLLVATQQAIETVSIGLRGLTASGGDLTIPGSHVQVTAARSDNTPAESLEVHRSAILAGGLRDCVDSLGVALVWAYRECVLWAQPGRITQRDDGTLSLAASITGKTWNREIIKGAVKFDRLVLPDKIVRLRTLGLPPPAFTEQILSLNAARNCLTHRQGIVGPQDLRARDDPGLTVTWVTLEFVASGDAGTRRGGVGLHVNAGELLSAEAVPRSRTFAFGLAVSLSEADFVEIAQTFVFYAQQIGAGILALQQERYARQQPPEGAG